MKLLDEMIREQVSTLLKENRYNPMTVHPFANDMANQVDTTPQENLYDDLVQAVLMEMLAGYEEDEIKEIIREMADRASSGPEGVGGRFTDAQVEEILNLVYERAEQKLDINLASHLPQDREHPLYRRDPREDLE